jgi:DNA-binding transcriptional LysR family regulator
MAYFANDGSDEDDAPPREGGPVAVESRAVPIISNGGRAIDVELLLFFHAVAETLSFTKAAKLLSIDQSWLSHKIREFEASLGLNLFIRSTRHVELTPAGRALLDPVRRLANVVGQARLTAEALCASMSGVLRVGSLPFSFPDPQRTRLIDTFIEGHPEIRLDITNGPSPVLLEHLRAGSIDLAFVSAPFETTGLDLLLLRENRFCIMLPQSHPLSERPVITAADLNGVKMIVPAQQYSPATFAAYYQPLIEAGAVPVQIPEFQSAPYYASDWELPVVCTQFAAERYDMDRFISRPLDFIPLCRKYLIRLSNHRTPPQRLMWDLVSASLGGLERAAA